jgi:hypothetical protein
VSESGDRSAIRLTVGIPTYDRPARLAETVGRVLPQLGPADELLVLDNASPTPAADVLAPLFARFPAVRARVVRHAVNIGGAANILRVVEEADPATWLWLLGDDDDVTPDAVAGIRATLEAHPGVLFVNFSADNHQRPTDRRTRGLAGFIAGIDSWSNLNFMSVDVFQVAAIQPVLRRGYHFAFSMSPHVALVFAALGDTGEALFSRVQVIAQHESGGWAPTLVLAGRPTLLDFPFAPRERHLLAARLRQETNLEYLTAYLVGEAQRLGDASYPLHLFDQVRGRLYGPDAPLGDRLRLRGYRLLVQRPGLGARVVQAVQAWRARRQQGSAAAHPSPTSDDASRY